MARRVIGDNLAALRQKPCGCVISCHIARDQSPAAVARIGQVHTHPDKSISKLVMLRTAISVPEFCAEHAKEKSV